MAFAEIRSHNAISDYNKILLKFDDKREINAGNQNSYCSRYEIQTSL